ncbi:hypothetical protein BH23ACT11_BH23ACT11_31070 [soil metagenome]
MLWVLMPLSASPAWAQELSVDKTGPGTVAQGEEIEYSIVVSNDGDAAARTVTLIDDVPAGTNFVSAETADGTCTQVADTVTCDLGTIEAGESETVTLTVRPGGASSITNVACAGSPDDGSGGGAPDCPAGTDDASDTATTRVVPKLTLDKLDDRDPVSVGSNVLYTLRVENEGSTTANEGEAVVVDELPIGEVRLVSVDSNSFDCDPLDPPTGRIRCTNTDPLESGEIASIKITVEPDEAGVITNDAVVRSSRFKTGSDTEDTTVTGEAIDPGDPDDPSDPGDGDGDGDNGDDGTADDQYGQDVEITNIINIPEKDLPETGGLPLLGILFAVFAGLGLLTTVLTRRS